MYLTTYSVNSIKNSGGVGDPNLGCIYCLLNDKKSAQKVCSKDLVYKGTFRLSSRTLGMLKTQ